MPTVLELGRDVKTKYPKVYDEYSDYELGRLVKTKYPEAYKDYEDVGTPGMPTVRVPGLNAPTETEQRIEQLPLRSKVAAKAVKWLAEGPAEGVPMIANSYEQAVGRNTKSLDDRAKATGRLVRGVFETARPAALMIPGAVAAADRVGRMKMAAEAVASQVAPEVVKQTVSKINEKTAAPYRIGPGAQSLMEEAAGALPFASMGSRIVNVGDTIQFPKLRNKPIKPLKTDPAELVELKRQTERIAPDEPFNSATRSAEVFASQPAAKNAEESARVFEAELSKPDATPVPKGPQVKSAQESARVFEQQQDPAQEYLRSVGTEETKGPAEQSAEVFTRVLGQREQQAARKAERQVSVPETGVADDVARLEDLQDRTSRTTTGKRYAELNEEERTVVDDLVQENMQGVGARAPKDPSVNRWSMPKSSRQEKQGRGRPIPFSRRNQRGSFSDRPIEPKPPEEDFFNLNRINVSKEEQQQLIPQIRGMAARGELVRDIEPHESILQEMASVGPELVEHVSRIPEQEGLRSRAAVQVIRERINKLSELIVDGTTRLADPVLSSTERDKLNADLVRWDNDQKQYLGAFAGIRTEWGRNLSALRMMANKTADDAFWVGQAKRAKGIFGDASLPDADLKKVRELTSAVRAAEKTGDLRAVQEAKANLAKSVAEMKESGWTETALALWKAGLLTSVKTHIRNVGGNLGFAVMEEMQRVPSSLVDMVITETVTNRRTVAGPSLRGMTNAVEEAATRGLAEASQIIKHGATVAEYANRDTNQELNFQKLRQLAERSDDALVKEVLGFTNDAINKYVNTVFRTLGAEDRIFRVYAMRRAIEAEAKLKALNEVRSGALPEIDLIHRANELTSNPTEAMVVNAAAYSEFATFNNPNFLAQGVSALANRFGQHGVPGKIAKAAVETTVPFKNTPANVMGRMFDYSPLGLAGKGGFYLGQALLKGTMDETQQKLFSEAIGRGLVGSAIMYAGYLAGRKGYAIGVADEKPEQQNVRYAAGQAKGSVLIGGKYHRINQFAPGASLFLMGADLARESTRTLKDEESRPMQIAKVGAKALLDQPMLQGAKDAIEALDSPERRANTFLTLKAGSLVPAMVSDIATVTDPVRREFQPPPSSNPLTPIAYGIKSRLPVLKSTLPVARDVFGQQLPTSQWNAVNPLLSQNAKNSSDPLFKTMVNDDFGIQTLRRENNETQEEFRIRKQLTGNIMLSQLRKLQLPENKDERIKAMRKAVSQSKQAVTKLVQDERFQKLTPEARIRYMNSLLPRFQVQ